MTINQSHNISVVIPAFNSAAFLAQALQSVLAQTLLPFEIIIVDDGSSDNTVKIAQSFNNDKIRIISQTNQGPSATRNTGVRAAKGEYIAFLDADDIWMPDKLTIQMGILQSYSEPAFSFTDYRYLFGDTIHPCKSLLRWHWAFKRTIDSSNYSVRKTINSGNYNDEIIMIFANGKNPVLYDNYILPSSILARRKDILKVGGFNESFRIAEDFEFLLRLYKEVPAIAVMQQLALYRQHTQQATSNSPLIKEQFIKVVDSILESPEKYPKTDIDYFIKSKFFRYYNLGFAQARLGQLDEAIQNFNNSLIAHWTLRSYLALNIAKIFHSTVGRSIFDIVRTLWKKRPGQLRTFQ